MYDVFIKTIYFFTFHDCKSILYIQSKTLICLLFTIIYTINCGWFIHRDESNRYRNDSSTPAIHNLEVLRFSTLCGFKSAEDVYLYYRINMLESELDITKNASDKSITLELGDVIQIYAQTNPQLHEQSFYVTYVDDQNIELYNISTFEPVALHIDDDGVLTDESIQSFGLRSRSEEPGYARQHLLLPKTWIDIYFGGEVPASITGEITNLEGDMIEITTYPNMDVIYIDFAFKGLPKHIPITQIVIRTKPASLAKIASLVDIRDQSVGDNAEMKESDSVSTMYYNDDGDIVVQTPENAQPDRSVREELHELYSMANEIIYGEDLGLFKQQVELPENQQRFSIETQTNDLLDELLMGIPESKRTQRVKDNIHLLIERFRELRTEFSKFDANGNVSTNTFLGNNYKPLVARIRKLDQKLKWIVPVVALRKKIYSNVPNDTYQDAEQLSIGDVLKDDQDVQQEYFKNQLRTGDITPYAHYNQTLNASFTPMESPIDADSYLTTNQQVQTSLECIVNNLDDFYSTVSSSSKDNVGYARKQYVIQKYDLGTKQLVPSISKMGKKIYTREQMTPNDVLTMRSLIALPLPVLHFSKIDLPMSSILTKSQYSHQFLQMFRLFHKKVDISTKAIEDFQQSVGNEFWKSTVEDGTIKRALHDFVLDERMEFDEDRFEKFLQTVFPDGETAVRMLDKIYPASKLSSFMSIQRAATALEPFLIYRDNLNYSQYNSIRFFIKEQLKKYRTEKENHRQDLNTYNSHRFEHSSQRESSALQLFSEKQDLLQVFLENYQLKTSRMKTLYETLGSSEIYSKVVGADFGTLFYDLIQFMMYSLVIPENLMRALDVAKEEDDMGRLEKIKAGDCVRRVLTKKYTSLTDLYKDNNNDAVYYDKEFDYTPYNLKDKYKDEQKKYNAQDFADFLSEVLVQKHDAPQKMSRETASDIIFGKKQIRDGEYAVVEIKPEPKMGLDEDGLSPNEKREMAIEANLRKKVAYYRRVNKQWIVDQDVDENAFIDSNDLFCNMSKFCLRDQKTKHCESLQDADKRLRSLASKKLSNEFDERFAISSQNVQDELKERIEKSMKQLKALENFRHLKSYKTNYYAFELGRFAKKAEGIRSPYLSVREKILGQGDFVKRQSDILKFAELFCRDPMVEQLGENRYMLYCKDTNTPLLPTFFLELAQAFVTTNTYLEKLGEIVRKQGAISDDGDSIVDKYSGYVLRKIDSVAEEGYDAQGFKIVTSDVVEQDIGQQFVAMMSGRQTLKDAVFEDEDTQMIFNLYRGISKNIGIPIDSIQENVLRISNEIITKYVTSKGLYEADAKQKEEKTQRKLPPYEIYRNKSIILIVASVILYCIQTAVPSFRVSKTFPGCVQSFDGFPDKEGSMENMMGVEYLACILNKMKTKTIAPWNSIKPLPVEIIKSQMVQMIQVTILPNSEYMEAYAKKREYMILHPDEDIPASHSIQRWVEFLPPVVQFSVKKGLQGVSNDYRDELIEMQRKGDPKQRNQIAMFSTKCTLFGFGVVEAINDIVKSKGLLLKTASGVYFTENACCNDRIAQSTLQYFEEENKEISVYVKMVQTWQTIIYDVGRRAKASLIYDPRRTGLTFSTELPAGHFETNVYLAFIHYCNLDDLRPIPEDLQTLFPEKIPDYPKKAPLPEKIEFLKRHGKRFNATSLKQLMAIIQRRNLVDTYINKSRGNRIQGLTDMLSYLDERYGTDEDNILSHSLREKMQAVLSKYNPKIMVVEDNQEVYKLNNWLTHANEALLMKITQFLEQHAHLSSGKISKLQDFLANIHMWNGDQGAISKKDESSMYIVTQFMRNSVCANSKVFPEMILNNHIQNTKSHDYWNFSPEHDLDISHFIRDYYKSLDKFKKDPVLHSLVGEVKRQLIDLNLFLSMIPLHSPYHKKTATGETQTFYSLFDKRTIYMIYCYVYYSVFCEYIAATDSSDLVQMDLVEKRIMRKNAIRENGDEFVLGVSREDYDTMEAAEYGSDRIEVEISSGNEDELKRRVAELIMTFLDIDMTNKKAIDITYEENDKKVVRSRLKEKKLITDFLRDLDPDVLAVEDVNKKLKLGRWNVGLRAGLVKYDAGRYEEERKQLFEQLNGRTDLEDVSDVPIRKDVNQIQLEQDQENDEFYDQEANDIRGYAGDDADGGYYEEDQDRDFAE